MLHFFNILKAFMFVICIEDKETCLKTQLAQYRVQRLLTSKKFLMMAIGRLDLIKIIEKNV